MQAFALEPQLRLQAFEYEASIAPLSLKSGWFGEWACVLMRDSAVWMLEPAWILIVTGLLVFAYLQDTEHAAHFD